MAKGAAVARGGIVNHPGRLPRAPSVGGPGKHGLPPVAVRENIPNGIDESGVRRIRCDRWLVGRGQLVCALEERDRAGPVAAAIGGFADQIEPEAARGKSAAENLEDVAGIINGVKLAVRRKGQPGIAGDYGGPARAEGHSGYDDLLPILSAIEADCRADALETSTDPCRHDIFRICRVDGQRDFPLRAVGAARGEGVGVR